MWSLKFKSSILSGENGPKIKILSDLPENFHTSQARDAEYKFDINMSKFDI